MRSRLPLLAIAVAALVGVLPWRLGFCTGLPQAGPVAMPASKQFDLSSRAGRDYRIFVAWPTGAPLPAGFPVIYVLDANSVFGTMVETLRIQQRHPPITGVSPAVVVGIGYPVDEPFDQKRRALDFVGDPDGLLTFIEEELRPLIERELRIDRSRQALFGHSSGGYFVLHALFTRPQSFQSYIAVSPDPHDRRLEQRFTRQIRDRCKNAASQRVRVLLYAAEFEGTLSPLMLKLPAPQREARLAAMQADGRVAKARELGARLAGLHNCGVDASFFEFPGENHASVLPVAINRMLPFVTGAAE